MTTTTTATTILDEFENDLQPSSTIPHCQIINPPNLSEAQIKKINPPYGFFIPQEKAEEVGFQPTPDWTLQDIEFENGSNSSIAKGFIATHCRLAILHRSGLEVQGLDSLDSQNRYYYLGLAYKGGQLTEIGQQAKDSPKVGTKSMFRIGTRMLLFFLDKDNKLLHNSPLQFTSRGGFGGSFGGELREYHKEINRVFGKLKKKSGMVFSPAALARVATDITLGYHKSEGKAPFTCVKARLAPAIDQVGVEKIVERRGYSVQLTGVPIQELLISYNSEPGQTIIQFHKDYENFPLPNRGITSAQSDEAEEVEELDKEWDGEF